MLKSYYGEIKVPRMSKALSHVTIRVNDFKASVDWYQQKLGLEPIGLHDDPFCFMKFPDGDEMIALLGAGRVDSEQGITPAIKVGDLRAVVEELKGRGVEFTGEIVDDEEGYRIVTMKDLEGNRISLWSE